MRRFTLMMLAVLAITAMLTGCGGGGENKLQPQRNVSATITIKWPARSRLIPAAANSVKVVAYNLSGFTAPRVLNRPTEGGLSTATFDRLPAGWIYFNADAFPQTDAGGVAQATATGSYNGAAGSHINITLTMASTITQVVVAPNNAIVDIDGTLPITATPKNASDEIVLVAPGNITFSSGSSSVVTVDPSTGVATGVRSAGTTITATESDSGISGSANITGAFPPGTFAGEQRTNPVDGATMVWVPAGDFLMGEYTGNADIYPLHTVALDGFWMYKHEVTYDRYLAFCTDTARAMPAAPAWGWLSNHPIVNVSWDDAKAYADWSALTLPTEAQWEKAARGTSGQQYPWAGVWNAANCNNNNTQTTTVGFYPTGVSPYGALDIAGNVEEWCADWYSATYYYLSPTTNPTGPTTGTARVVRGGDWGGVDPTLFLTTTRAFATPTTSADTLGFRCAVAARDALLDNSNVLDGTITIN